jgi:hypothetical protein
MTGGYTAIIRRRFSHGRRKAAGGKARQVRDPDHGNAVRQRRGQEGPAGRGLKDK